MPKHESISQTLKKTEFLFLKNRKSSKNITIRYYLHVGNKGYAISSESYVCALWLEGYNVEVMSINGVKPNIGSGIRERILHYCYYYKEQEREHEIVIIHDLPQRWKEVIDKEQGKRIYGLTVWETDKLPEKWIDYMNQVDDIITPCSWNKEVFEKDLNCRIHLINQPMENPKPFRVDQEWIEEEKKIGNKFLFYFIGEWCERKGIEDTIKAFNELNLDAILYIKTFMFNTILNEKDFENLVNKYRSNKVIINTQSVTSDFINSLHKRGDIYVTSGRGEGTGLGLAEAFTYNNKIVCCYYGGHKDYCITKYQVDFNVVPCNPCSSYHEKCKGKDRCQFYIWYDKSQNWCKPKLSSLKEQMLKAFSDGNKKTNYENKLTFKKCGEEFHKLLSTKILDEVETVQTKHYGKVKLFKKDNSICRWIKKNYIWEEFLVKEFKKLYKGGNVLDIGCYLGFHTIQFAQHLKTIETLGKVYAFEAHPTTYKLLVENTKDNRNVVTFNTIISDSDEQRYIDEFKNHEDGNFGGLSSFTENKGLKVETKSIDSFNFKNISLVKIDTEGHEIEVILGMKKLILEQKPILFVEICGGIDANKCSKEEKEEILKRCKMIEDFGYQKAERISPHDYIFLPR